MFRTELVLAREGEIIERLQISLTSLPTLKTDSHTNRGTSEGPETSADEYSTRRIQICRVHFCWDPFLHVF